MRVNKVPLDSKDLRKLAITEILAKLAIKMDRDNPAMKIDIQVIYAGACLRFFTCCHTLLGYLPVAGALFAKIHLLRHFFLLHADVQMQTFAARWCIVCTFFFFVTRWCIN